jgi:hypothetical protein
MNGVWLLHETFLSAAAAEKRNNPPAACNHSLFNDFVLDFG